MEKNKENSSTDILFEDDLVLLQGCLSIIQQQPIFSRE